MHKSLPGLTSKYAMVNAMFTRHCVKCKVEYKDTEDEDYYCEACNSARLQIAKEMDSKFNTVGQEPSGLLAAYDLARQGRKFPKASSIGL